MMRPLWVLWVSGHLKIQIWVVRHPTILVHVMTCSWLLNCTTGVFMLFCHLYTAKLKPPGAMRLRARGRDFELPTVKFEFNKRNFIVRSLFQYV